MKYRFFSEGFFGYGQEGDFQIFGFWHFLPIILAIIAIILTSKNKKKIREWKWETRFRYVLSFVMLMAEMSFFWRLLYVGSEGKYDTLTTKLPFQLCQWGLICCVFMVISLNDTLFNINFYVTFIGAVIALISPVVITRTGPTYFRYYQFWLEHLLPIYSTYYVMVVHKKRPKYRGLWLSYLLIFVLCIPATIANFSFPESNYLYLRQNIPIFPDNYAVRVVIYSVIFIFLFHVIFFIQRAVYGRSEKNKPKDK
ncbi:MAG: TIGR02206 family membrane protein [Lachnospiraceae bacterium]|nr:TIGR02206 family membrane protein [Lachnospiraceae bacterium]